MREDSDRCFSAAQARDARYDGWFVVAVPATGIYCRPGCEARPAVPDDVRFFATTAAAQSAGFRACRHCRPDAAPGSPEWQARDDVVARAMRLIADGAVDRDGVAGVARGVGCSTRQLQRMLRDEVGAGPLALARAQRAQTARLLIAGTDLPFADIAFAAGFSNVRRLNDAVRRVCGVTPAALRRAAASRPADEPTTGPGTLALRLPVRMPFAYEGVFAHLAASAVPGCEEFRAGAFRRTLRLPRGTGLVALVPSGDHVRCLLDLEDLRDLTTAIARCRRLLDLDADPEAVIETLGNDPVLNPVVAKAPGQRIPGTVDAAELAVRVVLGQQVSIKAARTHASRIVAAYGQPISDPVGTLTHTFPSVEQLADVDPAHLAFPRSRQRTFAALVAALADGSIVLGPGCDWPEARRKLLALPGIGPWSAEVIAMRGMGDPDAFPVTDLGVRAAADRLGLPSTPPALTERSLRWRPWRSYATQHLWTVLDHAVNEWPPKEAR